MKKVPGTWTRSVASNAAERSRERMRDDPEVGDMEASSEEEGTLAGTEEVTREVHTVLLRLCYKGKQSNRTGALKTGRVRKCVCTRTHVCMCV